MKQQILIIGSGFAGMWSALSAARLVDIHNRHDIQITVLAPKSELRVRPRFYEPNVKAHIAPLDELFAATHIHFVSGIAKTIHAHDNCVEFEDPHGRLSTLKYDRLVLASGSHVVRHHIKGASDYAFDVDQLESAARLEEHLKNLNNQPESLARNTVVIAGGGFTGIEVATEMPARLRKILGEKTPIKVIIVDRGAKIGARFGDEFGAVIAEASQELGVEWILNAQVTEVNANSITLSNGQRIDTQTVIWTIGVQANALVNQIQGTRDQQGRLHVDADLKVIGQKNIFATGDVAYAASDDLGNHALMTCQHAIMLGRYAGHNVAADLLNIGKLPYSQPKYVTCLDLGAWGAVYSEGWEREVKMVKAQAKTLKLAITSELIYPPKADKEAAFAAADPMAAIV